MTVEELKGLLDRAPEDAEVSYRTADGDCIDILGMEINYSAPDGYQPHVALL